LFQHFSRLYDSERDGNDDNNFQHDIPEENIDDIHDLLFNSPITEEEVTKSIKHINVNKATGGNLYQQHLIYGLSVLRLFFTEYEQRLKDKYIQSLRQKCLESSKLYHYANYKHVYEVSAYVRMSDLSKFRCYIANFRSCAHNLMIEEGI